MSITCYTGLPGSGKSYEVVRSVILPALREGRTVWTNIPLALDALERETGTRPTLFDVKDVIDNPGWFQQVLPAGALVVLDECWRLWPSGLKASNALEGHKSFLAEHRHMVGSDGRSTEIVLVTQDTGQLAAFVRQLIEKTYRTKKLDVLGQPNRYRIDIYEGCVTGASPPMDKRVREMYGEYKEEVYRYYQSHTMSQTGSAGNESKADQRANILRGGQVKAILAALVVLPIVVVWLGYKTYQGYTGKEAKAEAGASPAVASVQSVAPAPVRPRAQDGFLWSRDVSIIFNRSDGRTVDYVFRVSDSSGTVDLTAGDLYTLGYRVRPVTQCLARISGYGVEIYALCRADDPRGLVAQTIDNVSGRNL